MWRVLKSPSFSFGMFSLTCKEFLSKQQHSALKRDFDFDNESLILL
jgi:hypothetical protein